MLKNQTYYIILLEVILKGYLIYNNFFRNYIDSFYYIVFWFDTILLFLGTIAFIVSYSKELKTEENTDFKLNKWILWLSKIPELLFVYIATIQTGWFAGLYLIYHFVKAAKIMKDKN